MPTRDNGELFRKVKEQGVAITEEACWEPLCNVPFILERLGIDYRLRNVVEFGCGYGTFTVPVAKKISGTVTTFDLEELMIERTRRRAIAAGAYNIVYQRRDLLAEGSGLDPESKDACLLFNTLPFHQPRRLLAEAARVVRPGGLVLLLHWRSFPPTPSPPGIAASAEQIVAWANDTGILQMDGAVIDLPPWHYALRFRRPATGGA